MSDGVGVAVLTASQPEIESSDDGLCCEYIHTSGHMKFHYECVKLDSHQVPYLCAFSILRG